MNRAWTPAALEMEAAVRAALADLGGVDLARAAESAPAVRTERLRPVLASLGVLELDAFGGEDEAGAAVLAVRACGAAVAPWPVARALTVPPEAREAADALYLTDGAVSRLEHADLFHRALAADLGDTLRDDGPAHPVRAAGGPSAAPLDPFGVPVEVAAADGPPAPGRGVLMSLVLDAFWVAGALATILRQTSQYATTRQQFGRPIAQFGEIRWRLADMAVAADGLDELAAYTWFLVHRGRAMRADALALRVGMQETAGVVLKNGHQVFAAIGLCEEHDLAVIDRHLTPVLLRPAGPGRTAELLLEAVNREGFDAIFPVSSR